MSDIPTNQENEHVHLEAADTVDDAGRARLDAQSVKNVMLQKRIQDMSTTKKIIWAVVILVVVASAGYGIYKWKASSTKVEYATATVSKGMVTDSIEATGTLEAVRTSDMGFKNDDTITALNVQPGDHVTAGQILAEQDPTTLKTALQQAQNTVQQDTINVKSSQLNADTNGKTLDKQQQLFAAGAISQSDLDTAQNTYTKSEWDLELAQAKLANDQTKLAQAEKDMEEAKIVAPFDGIIGAVNGQVGSINGINSSSSTLLTVMSDELQMSSLVNEADIGRVKVGQEVEFTSSSFGTKTFTGQVVRVTPQAKTVSNVQYYPVLISVADPDKVLLSGMSVSAKIIIAREKDTLTVPMMAVSYAQTYLKSNPSQAPTGGGKSVLVMENGQPVVKSVKLGINDGSNYVVGEGLKEGDTVIIGTTQAPTTGSISGSSSTSSSTTRTNTNRNGGFGGPPGF